MLLRLHFTVQSKVINMVFGLTLDWFQVSGFSFNFTFLVSANCDAAVETSVNQGKIDSGHVDVDINRFGAFELQHNSIVIQ